MSVFTGSVQQPTEEGPFCGYGIMSIIGPVHKLFQNFGDFLFQITVFLFAVLVLLFFRIKIARPLFILFRFPVVAGFYMCVQVMIQIH